MNLDTIVERVRICLTSRAVEDLEVALVIYNRMLDEEKDYSLFIRRGNTHRYLGYIDEAISDFTEAISIHPSYLAYEKRSQVRAFKGELDLALQDAEIALSLKEKSNTWVTRGLVLWMRGEFENAIPDFDKAIEMDEKNPTFYVNRGAALNSLGRYKEAMEDFEMAESLGGNAALYGHMGDCHRMMGNLDEAEQNYMKSLELFEESGRNFDHYRIAIRAEKGMQKLGYSDDSVQREAIEVEMLNEELIKRIISF